MLSRHYAVSLIAVSPIIFGSVAASGQTYPNKPIRIVAAGAGSGGDFGARLTAPGLSAALGQPVIIDNRGGGSALTGEIVSRAVADGYTLIFAAATLWLAPFLQKTSYDSIRDFSPVSLVTRAPNVLVVTPALPVKSVSELIALAKAKPGTLNYASTANGTSPHLAAELFKALGGVNIVRVEYRTSAPGLAGVIGNEVQMMFSTAGAVAPHIKSGRLNALAVTGSRPSALAPGMPTVAESGLPGYDIESFNGILAPAKTPALVIARLNRDIVGVLHQADVKQKFFNSGTEVVASSPQELAVVMKSDMATLGKVIKEAGIKAD